MKNKLIALVSLLILLIVCGVLLVKRLNLSATSVPTTNQDSKKTDKNSDKLLSPKETSELAPTPTPVPTATTSIETDTTFDDLDKNIDSLNNSLDDLNL